MHILFVHQNYPAQFGHIARHLIRDHGHRCTFVTNRPPGRDGGIQRIAYRPQGGATARTHYCARNFENAIGHAHGVYEACKREIQDAPDLIVGHSGFGSTLFLKELYDCPILNYFEYFYHSHGSDLDFRPEFPVAEIDLLRSYAKNAMISLDLENCEAGYCPTAWQKSVLPAAYAPKLEVIFDGIDTEVWHRHLGGPRTVGDHAIGPSTRIVTYVSRGFESMRGFDIFMRVAQRIADEHPDVVFAVVGDDRVAYGGDLKHIQAKTFREHVLASGDYDLSKFAFLGRLPPADVARLLSVSDLHIYLTVPFVLSWSLFNALACGCAVVASDTPPVRELITHEQTGLMADFYDIDGLTEQSLRVLRDPDGYRHLGAAGMALIEDRYTLRRCLPQMLSLYERLLIPTRSEPARNRPAPVLQPTDL